MGKLVSWVAVVLLLLVVPLGSWFYLNKGLNYRKSALAELIPKDSIDISKDTLKMLAGKTSIVVLKSDNKTELFLADIKQQFKNTPKFQIIYRDSIYGSTFLPKDYLTINFLPYTKQTFVLIDEKLRIRNSYTNEVDQVRKMVEHIAITIPRPKESDIEMKK
jgi:hypothetical protein